MRKLFSLMTVILLFTSCGQKTNESNHSGYEITVDAFYSQPDTYLDETVTISGLVTHVCRHGGQKLFINGSEEGNSIRISASEELTEFPLGLEGSFVEFTGEIVKMDIATTTQVVEEEKEHHEGEDTCEAEKANLSKAAYYVLASSYKTID